MLYVYIQNITSPEHGVLSHADGTSDYNVAVNINEYQLTAFKIYGYKRDAGWEELLRRIADEGDRVKKCKHKRPKKQKRPCAICQSASYREWLFRMNTLAAAAGCAVEGYAYA